MITPIPTKSLKEVNKISKYFKIQKSSQATTSLGKLYGQAFIISSNTNNVLKIKEAFLSLKAKNINNIQKIIKCDGKLKLQINITTNGLSKKQVIISMNDDNKKNFMEKSSVYITNMNRALKNIKTEVMVDFI